MSEECIEINAMNRVIGVFKIVLFDLWDCNLTSPNLDIYNWIKYNALYLIMMVLKSWTTHLLTINYR